MNGTDYAIAIANGFRGRLLSRLAAHITLGQPEAGNPQSRQLRTTRLFRLPDRRPRADGLPGWIAELADRGGRADATIVGGARAHKATAPEIEMGSQACNVVGPAKPGRIFPSAKVTAQFSAYRVAAVAWAYGEISPLHVYSEVPPTLTVRAWLERITASPMPMDNRATSVAPRSPRAARLAARPSPLTAPRATPTILLPMTNSPPSLPRT